MLTVRDVGDYAYYGGSLVGSVGVMSALETPSVNVRNVSLLKVPSCMFFYYITAHSLMWSLLLSDYAAHLTCSSCELVVTDRRQYRLYKQ